MSEIQIGSHWYIIPNVLHNVATGVAALANGFGPLPGNGPNSMGSTGRQPQNVKEQEAMREAQSNPQAGQPGGKKPLGDNRWPASDGWVKMRQNINGVEVHYNYNTRTGATDDWKIK